MANGWIVQETSGVFNNQPVLLRVDYTKKDQQGFEVRPITSTNLVEIQKNYMFCVFIRIRARLFMRYPALTKAVMTYSILM